MGLRSTQRVALSGEEPYRPCGPASCLGDLTPSRTLHCSPFSSLETWSDTKQLASSKSQ